jgi:hypothetical protein
MPRSADCGDQATHQHQQLPTRARLVRRQLHGQPHLRVLAAGRGPDTGDDNPAGTGYGRGVRVGAMLAEPTPVAFGTPAGVRTVDGLHRRRCIQFHAHRPRRSRRPVASQRRHSRNLLPVGERSLPVPLQRGHALNGQIQQATA